MENQKKAKIALEDGMVLNGYSFGAEGEIGGEVVFNTSMTGYQEILTDPSYKGQIVTMTYPLIGNYGVNEEDVESKKPFVEGFVVRECSRLASNWRSKKDLSSYLKEHNIPGIEGIDTRAITRHIRLKGAMKAVISTENLEDVSLVKKAKSLPDLVGRDLVKEVTSNSIRDWNNEGKYKIVVVDCGVKFNILRILESYKCRVVLVPATATYEEIIKLKPDGILLSNGPGDPQAVSYLIETVKKLIGKVPIFGICLGHQIIGLALGGKSYKLKFGHHGGNQPVKDLRTGRVVITSQNHGFCIKEGSLDKNKIESTHINLNDHTLEGVKSEELRLFSIQFHPESSPGPHDAKYLFEEFINLIERKDA